MSTAVITSLFGMGRQRRPSGPMWSVDDAWKKDVLARMKTRGISRADLAREIHVTGAAITQLFQPQTTQTRLKPAIHKALGLVAPTTSPAIEKDEAFSRLLRVWRDLSEEERLHLVATGELLKRSR